MTASPARGDGDLDIVAGDVLRAAARVVIALFVGFAIYNAVAFPGGVREAMVAYDLVLVAAGLAIHRAGRRGAMPIARVQAVGAGLSLAVLGNILLAALLGVSPQFTVYVTVLIVASVGSMLSSWWAIGVGLVLVGGWAVVAALILDRSQLVVGALVMSASLGGALVVHMGRSRAHARITALRAEDARREVELQRALERADAARIELDDKVAARTQDLRDELERRDRLEAQLRHVQKLDAIGRLAGGVAHDFNNLLTVIRMSHETIRDPASDAATTAEAIRDADDATDRAASLTRDLLAFARKQALERTQLSVEEVVEGALRMVRRLVDASVRLDVDVASDAGDVVADARQIAQVVMNLAINACDAMANRGALGIVAERVEITEAAPVCGLACGTYVRIAVSDTGVGMDDATLSSVFEPFFTTKEVGQGTGLGLAVAHGIVTQHGGDIDVVSALGKGSTFAVYLPAARGRSGPRDVVTVATPTARAGELVLLVEDEPAVRRALQRSLEKLGYRVIVARDGEHALDEAAKIDGVDLLLTDVVMPGIDGGELATRLRARWPGLPVLFLTGYSRERLQGDGVVGPRDQVLEKPYRQSELAEAIRQILGPTPPAPPQVDAPGAPR